MNRLGNACNIPRKAAIDKQKRGSSEQRTAQDNTVTVVGWKDNKVVYLVSNCEKKTPQTKVERYCRDSKAKILVPQPNPIRKYNKAMGGVDRADQNISTYRIGIRSKKWWWPLFAWIPDMVMQNAWLLYRKFKKPEDQSYDLLGFRREIVNVCLMKFRSPARGVGRPRAIVNTASTSCRKPVPADVRFDGFRHFSTESPTNKKCGHCGGTVRKWCSKCQRGLHDKCFNAFHDYQ